MKQNRKFLILGVTGGAGSGKTTVIEEIEKLVPTVFLHCDVIAHRLMEPGGASYGALIAEFGEEILEDAEGGLPENSVNPAEASGKSRMRKISRPKLAAVAMATEQSRQRLNELSHPLVQQEVEAELERLQIEQFQGVAVIEAALLIEAGYKKICDSLWYVYAPLTDRIRRMKENRGYSEEKIAGILAGQLTEEKFRAEADVVIENGDQTKEEAKTNISEQISKYLKECMESLDKMC